jgi:hypothetical protein
VRREDLEPRTIFTPSGVAVSTNLVANEGICMNSHTSVCIAQSCWLVVTWTFAWHRTLLKVPGGAGHGQRRGDIVD